MKNAGTIPAWRLAFLLLFCILHFSFLASAADAPAVLSLPNAVAYALEHNPQLGVARTQRGLANAGVVIARTYPFNPQLESVVLGANGPPAAGITNRVFNEHILSLQLELRGQRFHRRAAACAALSRAESEIAAQELTTAIAVIRAYNTVLYRQQKLQILEETVRLNERIVDRGRRLAELAQLRPAEVILAKSELDTSKAQRGQGRTNVAVARAELRQQMGTLDDAFATVGELSSAIDPLDCDALTQNALSLRPEVNARKSGVCEAQALLGLQVADRFGNPSLGARYEFNESRVNFVGGVAIIPIAILNTRRGEILQKQAELARAQAELRQIELQVAQAVQSALARLAEARKWAEQYPAEVLPNLQHAREDMEKLFAQNEQGVDVLRVLGVQTNFLKATDAYLDARYELSQAIADLAAAVGEPTLALGAPQVLTTSPANVEPVNWKSSGK